MLTLVHIRIGETIIRNNKIRLRFCDKDFLNRRIGERKEGVDLPSLNQIQINVEMIM